jgi:beta propeller repeat protein
MRTRLGLVSVIAATMIFSGAVVAQASWWPLHTEFDHGANGDGHWAPSLTKPTAHDGFIAYARPDTNGIYVDPAGGAGSMVRLPPGFDQLIGPASIDGTRVVYTARQSDGGRTDIFIWDRTNPDGAQVRLSNDTTLDAFPVISGNHVAWLRANEGDVDVWLYDLDTGTGQFIAPYLTGNTDLVMDGNHIAWASLIAGESYNIILHDIDTGATEEYTVSGGDERYPALDGEMIAYSNKGGGDNFDLIMQPIDRSTGGKYISWAPGDQIHASISGDVIAWQDNRSGSWDIRAACYSDPIPHYNSQLIAGGARDQTAPSVWGSTIAWVDQYDDALHTTVMDLDLRSPVHFSADFLATPSYGAISRVTVHLRNAVGDSLAKRGTLYSSANFDGPWKSLGAYTFGTSFSVKLTGRTYYKAVFAGDTFNAAPGPDSGQIVGPIMPKVLLGGLKVSTTTVKAGKKYTWSGDLKPRHAAGLESVTLRFYHKEGSAWVLRSTVDAKNYNYSTYSRFKLSTALAQKGSWRVQAYSPADTLHAATTGAWKYFTVK